MENFINLFAQAMKSHWDSPALTDYGRTDITYGQMAAKIEKLHILWDEAGLVKGDRIAICAKSSSGWSIVFWAALTGGYVPVELFSGFLPHDAASLVMHSGSRILYTERAIFEAMDPHDIWTGLTCLLALPSLLYLGHVKRGVWLIVLPSDKVLACMAAIFLIFLFVTVKATRKYIRTNRILRKYEVKT